MIPVPAWTLSLAFVLGLLVGAGVFSLMRRGSTVPEQPVAPPEPTRDPTPPPAVQAVPKSVEAAAEPSLAAGVDDVVSELERRYKGRKVDPATEGSPKDRRRQ